MPATLSVGRSADVKDALLPGWIVPGKNIGFVKHVSDAYENTTFFGLSRCMV